MIKQIIVVIQQLIPLMQQLLKRKQNEEMVIRICKEEGLTPEQEMDIRGTIAAESSFDDKAINKNSNGTYDYGIIQANSLWYIAKMKLLTKDEALNDPEKCFIFG